MNHCRQLAEIDHPHIIAVQGAGRTREGGYFAVMEWLRGANLPDCANRGELSLNMSLKDCAKRSAGRTVIPPPRTTCSHREVEGCDY